MARVLLAGGVLLAAGVLLVALAALTGVFLPRAHEVARSRDLPIPPGAVYRILRDVGGSAAWRDGVQRVEVLPDVDRRPRFREVGRHGATTYEILEETPGLRLVTRIADTDLGYSGAWTYDLAPLGTGTRLTITERGEVSNVLFRFLSRFVFGQAGTIEACLSSLEAHVRAVGGTAGSAR